MKKFLWITVFFIVTAAIVYVSNPSGKFNPSFFNFNSTGGFESYLDEAAKEISGNQYLAAPAVFTVSDFINAYDSGNDLSGLIETEIRNSLSQSMPGRVTVYKYFKKAEERKTEKNAPEKNKKQNASNSNAKKTADPEGKTELGKVEEKSEETADVLKHSGNFVVSGTYKEDDSTLIIHIYVSDAENGRGYYAKRIEMSMDKLPMLFTKKTVPMPAEAETIPAVEKNMPAETKINIVNNENKAMKNTKTDKQDKYNKEAAKEIKKQIKQADSAETNKYNINADSNKDSNIVNPVPMQPDIPTEQETTDSSMESDPLHEHNEPDYNAAVPL